MSTKEEKKQVEKKDKKSATEKRKKKRLVKGKVARLWTRGIVTGYRRGKHYQYPSLSLLKLEGVNTRKDTSYYLGKKVAYIYKAKTAANTFRGKKSKIRVIWGKVVKSHGNNGAVRARFRSNLPPKSFGRTVRVMLYPSRI